MKIAILTGAGISAESGLGTFRDQNGLWTRYDLNKVATPEGFARNPKLVHDFYNTRRANCMAAAPNAAHRASPVWPTVHMMSMICTHVQAAGTLFICMAP